jgi:hypothetical protein
MKNKTLPITIGIAVVVGMAVGRLITPWFKLESPLAAFAVSITITVVLLLIIEGIAGKVKAGRAERIPLGEIKNLYTVKKSEIPKAAKVLADAFQEDPLFNSLFGNAVDRSYKYSKVAEMMLRHCISYGAVYASSEQFEGIMAVTQDRNTYITTWRLIRSRGIVPFLSIGLRSFMKVAGSLSPIDEVRRKQMKNRAYAYIQIIGVASEHQGKGYGGKMLRSMLAASDEVNLPIYLETESESNVALYERFGFSTCEHMKLPIIDQPMWAMIRETRQ